MDDAFFQQVHLSSLATHYSTLNNILLNFEPENSLIIYNKIIKLD